MKFKVLVHLILRPMGKYRFINTYCKKNTILDIGCGKSPNRIKTLFPESKYTGLDITSHYLDSECLADNYVLTPVENFSSVLSSFEEKFDCVISSHNLEHCDDRILTLEKSAGAVKKGGFMYLSYPSEESINFPKGRIGTLNYFDDPTHKDLPPTMSEILPILEKKGFNVIYKNSSYKPLLLWILGLILEPFAAVKNKVLKGTLQFYGFETVIWLKRDRY